MCQIPIVQHQRDQHSTVPLWWNSDRQNQYYMYSLHHFSTKWPVIHVGHESGVQINRLWKFLHLGLSFDCAMINQLMRSRRLIENIFTLEDRTSSSFLLKASPGHHKTHHTLFIASGNLTDEKRILHNNITVLIYFWWTCYPEDIQERIEAEFEYQLNLPYIIQAG